MPHARRLALFPLPLVLFPGAPLPLHIFEPRYRRLLADVRAGDGRFGIISTDGGPEGALPPGRVGCVAELRDVDLLPDGRANIMVEGGERFALERLVADAPEPYRVGRVVAYGDEPEPGAAAELARLDERVRGLFQRVARAARTLADDREPLPALPADPALVAFRIASLVDLELAARQRLLASRSAVTRLREVDGLLAGAVDALEQRASVHHHAQSNGRGPGQ